MSRIREFNTFLKYKILIFKSNRLCGFTALVFQKFLTRICFYLEHSI